MILRGIGEALARLHAVLPRPEEIRTQAFERERLERVVKERVDQPAGWTEELLEAAARWEREAPASEDEERERLATIHGDLYPDQILVEPGAVGDATALAGLAILDWDALCAGRSERDVGNFEAHLVLEEARARLAPDEADALRPGFREGYASVRPLDQAWLAWYLRGSLLRLAALYADPDFGAHPPNPPDLPRALLEASALI
jgi:Ser/Thr protein kinase RdoA (MazF antagonist)